MSEAVFRTLQRSGLVLPGPRPDYFQVDNTPRSEIRNVEFRLILTATLVLSCKSATMRWSVPQSRPYTYGQRHLFRHHAIWAPIRPVLQNIFEAEIEEAGLRTVRADKYLLAFSHHARYMETPKVRRGCSDLTGRNPDSSEEIVG